VGKREEVFGSSAIHEHLVTLSHQPPMHPRGQPQVLPSTTHKDPGHPALRSCQPCSPEFGCYAPAHVTCEFVQGNYVANGPLVMYYRHIDYVAWLLSDESTWLPNRIRDELTRRMAEWGACPWDEGDPRTAQEFGFEDAPFTGRMFDALRDARTEGLTGPTSHSGELYKDLVHRLSPRVSSWLRTRGSLGRGGIGEPGWFHVGVAARE